MPSLSESAAKQCRCPHINNAPGGQGLCVASQCMMWRWVHDLRHVSKPKAISNLGRDAFQKEVHDAVKEGFTLVRDSGGGVTLMRQTDHGYCGLAGRVVPDFREVQDI